MSCRVQEADKEGAEQGQVAQRLPRPVEGRGLLDGFQFIEHLVDVGQFLRVARAEVLAAGHAGDLPERLLIQFRRGVDTAAAETGTEQSRQCQRVGTDPDGIDPDAQLGGEARGVQWRHGTRGVLPVGEQDQYAALRGPFLQALDREPDGVADGGFLAGEADARLRQEALDRVGIEAQGRLHVGLGAEQDEPHPVAAALADELRAQLPDRLDPGRHGLAHLHVLDAHGAGNIHRHHQVATTVGQFDGLADPHGPRRGGQQQQPEQPEQEMRQQAAARAAAGLGFTQLPPLPEEGRAHGRLLAVGRGCQAAHQPGQGRQQRDPGPGPLDHAATR